MNSKLIFSLAHNALLQGPPKKVVLSGPSGFIGSKVLCIMLKVHELRQSNGLEPGELILLSGSPGNLMGRLVSQYGSCVMQTVRASRVDYYVQHNPDEWRDHLGSLGLGGNNSVFVNLAGVAGPIANKPDAMMKINYRSVVAAAEACQSLEFGHWVQSSTQATFTERAGQVPYSRGKMMADYALSRMHGLPVTIANIGVTYNGKTGSVGHNASVNLSDLSLLPITPILGTGTAPLQPQEVMDIADRLTLLALMNPTDRPIQKQADYDKAYEESHLRSYTFRRYDAVGPETLSLLEFLERFAVYQGNSNFRPVHINYRNMERILNVKNLGNLNRQFVSFLRSEQDNDNPAVGDPTVWEGLMGPGAKLTTLDEAFAPKSDEDRPKKKQRFPYVDLAKHVMKNPGVIPHGLALLQEAFVALCRGQGKSL